MMVHKLMRSMLGRSRYTALREAYYLYQDVRQRAPEYDWMDSRRAVLSENRKRIASFHNLHRRQRCFIIGNGPSLRSMDLSPLRNEITFGLNRIYLMFQALGFESTYLVAVNELVITQCAQEIGALTMPKFMSMAALGKIKRSDSTVLLNTTGGAPCFAKDMRKVVWESGTVTYVAMQLAYYLGFAEVVLVGVDHSFAAKGAANQAVISDGDDPNHFSKEYFGKGFVWQLPDLQSSEMGYRLAREVYESDGRRIVDATIGGKLDIFPKVEYLQLFK